MIELQEVTKKFGKHQIFDRYSLSISAEKMTAILGRSGAGKSTLLNLIGLIEEADSGQVYIAGKKAPQINSKEALLMRRNFISFLFQNFALIEDESIERNLNISLVYEKIKKTEKRRQILLADEPTGSLDEQNRVLILGLLRQEVEKGKTVIIVTHDPAVVAACDEYIEI
ncbi:ATP-binding cassette domain-containing protein [Lactococcus garvieae]|uniref:ATP-binding cassette domain-containing protein n=1 Tax=Lactococcus garvieae TaxID=1363 RepID=UPI0037127695